jgi:uncharacterized glyoxalase superfamily protein PhnB
MSAVRPPNTPVLTPYLTVQDAAKSIAFYEKAFGFELIYKSEQDNRIVHVQMGWNGEQIVMFAPENVFGMTAKSPRTLGIETPFSLYLYTADVDAQYQRAVDAGCISRMAPENMFWGERYCMVEDIDGYRWGFGMQTEKPGEII